MTPLVYQQKELVAIILYQTILNLELALIQKLLTIFSIQLRFKLQAKKSYVKHGLNNAF